MADRRARFNAIASDIGLAARLDRRTKADLIRAVAELALARVRLGRQPIANMVGAGDVPDASNLPIDPDQRARIDRVAFAIPRVAARVPFRSDCLVQALAARHWLARRGIAARLTIGAKLKEGAALDAHAWLEAGGRIVTGGDVSGYTPFKAPPAF